MAFSFKFVWLRDCTLRRMYALPVAFNHRDGKKGELLYGKTLEIRRINPQKRKKEKKKIIGVYVSSKVGHTFSVMCYL